MRLDESEPFLVSFGPSRMRASPKLADMPISPLAAARSAVDTSPITWGRRWWRRQTPTLQDALAMLAPLAAVLLFLAAIVSAFWYLRAEEIGREQESVRRDVEYAQ